MTSVSANLKKCHNMYSEMTSRMKKIIFIIVTVLTFTESSQKIKKKL